MYLYGASGHAKVIVDILKSMNVSVSGVFDDDPALKEFGQFEFLGRYQGQPLKAPLIISIGDNRIRARIAAQLKLNFGIAIHQSTIKSSSATIGAGTVVMQGAIIQASALVGQHVIVNTRASIDHDCRIRDFVHISPGAVICGNVEVGEGSHIGAGAIIIPNLKIGKWCRIGAGAVIIRDVPDFATVVGNPGKIISST